MERRHAVLDISPLSLANVVGLALLMLGSGMLMIRKGQAMLKTARVLYLTHSAGYRHEVLPRSQAVLEQLGDRPQSTIDQAEHAQGHRP